MTTSRAPRPARLLPSACLALAALLCAGCAGGSGAGADDAARARELFRARCSACHG